MPRRDNKGALAFRVLLVYSSAVVLWTLVSSLTGDRLFPTPLQTAGALWEMLWSGELLQDILMSVTRTLVGFIVGGVLGIAVGYATGATRIVDQAIGGLLQLLRPLPPVSLVPLFILWFGINEPSKYAMVAFGTFFPVWINTHLGVHAVDPKYIWIARSLGATPSALALRVVLPAALPTIVAGLRTSIGIAFFCLVAAELAGALNGIVYRLNVAHLAFRVDRLLACLIVLGALSALCDNLFVRATRATFPWLRTPILKEEA